MIGCEYASIFRSLGREGEPYQHRDRLLSFLDDEISDALSYHLRDKGVVIRHDEAYEKVIGTDDGVVIELQSGKKIKSDLLAVCPGPQRQHPSWGWKTSGSSPTAAATSRLTRFTALWTNPTSMRLATRSGSRRSASASYDQGRFAAKHLVDGDTDHTWWSSFRRGFIPCPKSVRSAKPKGSSQQRRFPTKWARPSSETWRAHRSRDQPLGC